MKVLSFVGARPQFIKAASVSKEFREKEITEILVHSGQHYDFSMSEIFFKELDLPKPDYYLGIGSGLHGDQTGRMLVEIEKMLIKEKPDIVVVYGDTNTTLASALAAVKLKLPIGHVEAGLRSYNKSMPEEINRLITDVVSDILFAPTDVAVENLKKEGIIKNVYKVGDVMFDIALKVKEKFIDKEEIFLSTCGLERSKFTLVTVHRAENTDIKENLENIWNALVEIAETGIKVFFPVHPRTIKALEKFNLLKEEIPENLIISKPVGYAKMIALESNAKLIITDSGGVQKEGYFFKTHCVILRNETEWTELVDAGWNKIVGNKKENIVKTVLNKLKDNFIDKEWIAFYGSGKSSERVVEKVINYF
ncbi:MAG: UDP-N-acetylglucosamine 2-epimerase (non-hydrolyzing) [Deltaproteobacteria bacterium]|nr:UDP-N-acetylglucosamine 2-epimerase (non-hydrolyzing) [Deltaproteobacteria bacterium]